jgi:acetyl esterase/lipase
MISRRRIFDFGILATSTALLSSCSTLKIFDNVTPKDRGSVIIAKNLHYGENLRQTMDVYVPKKGQPNLGTIIFFYGGGWNSGKKEDYSWVGRSLAALGYYVFMPDYRLYPEVKYPDFVTDCALALDFVVANGEKLGAKTDNIALIGHSAGAYNAAMLVVNDDYSKESFKNIKAFVGIAGPYDFYPFNVAESKNAFGDYPKPELSQPVNIVKKSDIDFLLLHSKADKVVGFYNSQNLKTALISHGNKVELIEYQTQSHQEMVAALSIPFRAKADVRNRIKDFLKSVL